MKVGKVSNGNITIENTPLEEVEESTYLGNVIDKNGGTGVDIKARIGTYSAAESVEGKYSFIEDKDQTPQLECEISHVWL